MHSFQKTVDSFLALDEQDKSLVSQIMFFVPLGLWLLTVLLINKTLFASTVSKLIAGFDFRAVCFAILMTREVLFGRWDRRAFIGLIVCVFMAYLAHETIPTWNMILIRDSAILLFFGRNVPFRKIAAFCFVLLTAVVLVTALCSLVGIIPDKVTVSGGNRVRHLLGFKHPNFGPSLAFFALGLWIFMRGRRFNLIDAAISAAVILFLCIAANSRTSLITSVGLIVCAVVLRWVPDSLLRHPALKVLAVGSAIICAALGIGLSVAYDPAVPWMQSLNNLFTGRLALAHSAIAKYGFTLVPQAVSLSSEKGGITVDCVYVNLCVSVGVPFLIMGLVLATAVNARAFRNAQWYLLVVLGFIAVHGILQSNCGHADYNPFLFLMGELFYSGRSSGYYMGAGRRFRGKHARQSNVP